MTLALLANLTLFVVTLGYVVLCAVSPFGDCRKCDGFGAKVRVTRRGRAKVGRICRRCRGEGKRLRIGRRLHNRARRLRRDGTR
ncbi:hypothetical protein LRS74_17350 [Streptomyces sp. LX-29]|uniref:hypothetical protein n=1 Tax=Streptomyces sp. LX-29 TaxID=2900152 RepID=UPI00240CF8C8|nr:hypothetical protein [Streptomyces sp. LX-29]WFB08618.1 hypothetical protein LRS74_17350 [Streptomyces sp. LX-29]